MANASLSAVAAAPHRLDVDVRKVSHAFQLAGARLPVLQDIDLNVAPGEFVALLGPSGCGKSTLLRLIAGLDRPSRGEIFADNARIEAPEPSLGDSNPATNRSKVDLPQPDGPNSATNSPAATLRSIDSSTGSRLPPRSKLWLSARMSSDTLRASAAAISLNGAFTR